MGGCYIRSTNFFKKMKRKLFAVGYHDPDVDVVDGKNLRNLVVWLEDRIIRYYKVEDRTVLRDTDSAAWEEAFAGYLADLGSPWKPSDNAPVVVDWLLTYAVHTVAEDDSGKFRSMTGAKVAAATAPKGNPFPGVDFQSEAFKKTISQVGTILSLPKHPDHMVMLSGAALLAKERLSVAALKKAKETESGKAKPFPLGERGLLYDTGDKVMNTAYQVMRLRHIADLRDLQTNINETIVAVQNITANP